jgi:hypothetical protein
MRAYRKRKRDAGFKNVRRWEPAEGVQQYSDRRILDARSLALHCKIGSQAILGQFPDAPVRLLSSMEAHVYPKNHPEKADEVDGAIGEGSSYHELHGYYAQGVGKTTAVLPADRESRLVAVKNENTSGVTGYCPEAHDLAISKMIAMWPKDLDFVQELVRHDMINKKTMLHRLKQTDLEGSIRRIAQARIKSFFKS